MCRTVLRHELAHEPMIIYPRSPRPSYADQVISLLRDRSIKLELMIRVIARKYED